MPALVLDAHLKSALVSIRSLAEKGIHVVAGAERRTAMGLHSRHAAATFTYPSPLQHREAFLEEVYRAARTAPAPPVLYAFSDATFIPLFEDWARAGQDVLGILPANGEAVATAFDKAATLDLAARLAIEVPRTLHWDGFAPLDGVARSLGYPVVVKPRRSASWRGPSGTQNAAVFAYGDGELERQCRRIQRETGEFPLLQEFIQGEELGVEFLCRNGEPLAVCAHRRIRSLSPAGGAAVVKETVREDYGRIGEYGRRLMAALCWSGPAMVEFKIDRRDGRPRLMEINGRFWGSLPLAVVAGVDFPYLYYLLATGRPLPPAPPYREGIRSRHWLGDVGHLLAVLFRHDPLRRFAYPHRAAAVRDFLLTTGVCYGDVASAGDPAPGLMELVDHLRRRLR